MYFKKLSTYQCSFYRTLNSEVNKKRDVPIYEKKNPGVITDLHVQC